MSLTKDGLLARARRTKEVELEGGGSVCVRVMTAGERIALEEGYEAAGKKDLASRVIAASACDEAGALLFGPGDLEGVHAAFSGAEAEAVFEASLRLNKMLREERDAMGKGSEDRPTNG